MRRCLPWSLGWYFVAFVHCAMPRSQGEIDEGRGTTHRSKAQASVELLRWDQLPPPIADASRVDADQVTGEHAFHSLPQTHGIRIALPVQPPGFGHAVPGHTSAPSVASVAGKDPAMGDPSTSNPAASNPAASNPSTSNPAAKNSSYLIRLRPRLPNDAEDYPWHCQQVLPSRLAPSASTACEGSGAQDAYLLFYDPGGKHRRLPLYIDAEYEIEVKVLPALPPNAAPESVEQQQARLGACASDARAWPQRMQVSVDYGRSFCAGLFRDEDALVEKMRHRFRAGGGPGFAFMTLNEAPIGDEDSFWSELGARSELGAKTYAWRRKTAELDHLRQCIVSLYNRAVMPDGLGVRRAAAGGMIPSDGRQKNFHLDIGFFLHAVFARSPGTQVCEGEVVDTAPGTPNFCQGTIHEDKGAQVTLLAGSYHPSRAYHRTSPEVDERPYLRLHFPSVIWSSMFGLKIAGNNSR